MKKVELTAKGIERGFDGKIFKTSWKYSVIRCDDGDIYITSEEAGSGEFRHAAILEDGGDVYVESRDNWGDLNRDGYVYLEMVDGTTWWEDEQLMGMLERPINHPERIHWDNNKNDFRQGNGAELPAGLEDDVKWQYCDIDKKFNI